MKLLSKYSTAGLLAFLAVWSVVAAAQEPANQNHPPKPGEDPGGPAPVHDLSGTWLAGGTELEQPCSSDDAGGASEVKAQYPRPV
jgi:hypothetical protein